MIQNLDYMAKFKNSKIIIVFNGNLPCLETDYKIPRLTQFIEHTLKSEAIKNNFSYNNPNPDKNYKNFVLPTEIRNFINNFYFNDLICLFTKGEHTKNVCQWLREGIPINLLPNSWTQNGNSQNLKIESNISTIFPTDFLGHRNEYILQLYKYEQKINYFHSPSLVLGKRNLKTDQPTYFQAFKIVPDCTSKFIEEENFNFSGLLKLIHCSILLDGENEYLNYKLLDAFHFKLLDLSESTLSQANKLNKVDQRLLDLLDLRGFLLFF